METQSAPWSPGIRNGEQVRPERAQVQLSALLGSQEPMKHILEIEDSKCEQPQMRPGVEPPRHSQEPLVCGGKMWGLGGHNKDLGFYSVSEESHRKSPLVSGWHNRT